MAPLSFTTGQARSRRGVGALVARHQAYLFFPLLLLEALHLYANSVRAVLGPRPMVRRPAEAVLLALHIGGYLTAVILVLTPAQAVAFILVNQGVLGLYLGFSFGRAPGLGKRGVENVGERGPLPATPGEPPGR